MVNKAVIYTRVSKQDQSFQRQINQLKEAKKDFEIVKIFKEKISGFTVSYKNREEFQKLINYVTANDIDLVMVHEISRLGRRTKELLEIIEEFENLSIKLYIHNLGITLGNGGYQDATNKLIVTILGDLARMESETLSSRIKSGIKERKSQGKTTGRQPGSVESEKQFLSKHANVIAELESGESIRRTAKLCGVSPTTVQKVKRMII